MLFTELMFINMTALHVLVGISVCFGGSKRVQKMSTANRQTSI